MAGPFDAFRSRPTPPPTPKPALPPPGSRPELWGDWTAEWLEYYTQVPTPMACLHPAINADQENNLKGKLGVFIGSGGTRKSYGVQNVIAENVFGYGNRWIYSSMEMGKPEVVNRMLDIAVPPESGEAASSFLRRIVREDKEVVAAYLDQAAQVLDNNLILSNESRKTCEDYEKLIQDTIREYGPVDGLAIDGLSAMGGKGEETERYSSITLDLKELAKRYNIFIALICHTTKAAQPHTRDSRPFVRGSEKILDNSDFSICFSNIIDTRVSTPDNLMYASHLGHIKYYNKRGSGKMLNLLMQFDGLTKTFTPADAPLIEFPDYDTFVREYNAEKRKADRDGSAPW